MRRRNFFSSNNDDENESLINLTPLIDVVFVVLVAFILIAPLLEMDKIELANASESSQQEVSKKSKIMIYVREDDSIWVNNRLVTDIELLAILRQSKKDYPTFAPQLYHDKKACFGTYQKVKIASEKAGFSSLDLILKGH